MLIKSATWIYKNPRNKQQHMYLFKSLFELNMNFLTILMGGLWLRFSKVLPSSLKLRASSLMPGKRSTCTPPGTIDAQVDQFR